MWSSRSAFVATKVAGAAGAADVTSALCLLGIVDDGQWAVIASAGV